MARHGPRLGSQTTVAQAVAPRTVKTTRIQPIPNATGRDTGKIQPIPNAKTTRGNSRFKKATVASNDALTSVHGAKHTIVKGPRSFFFGKNEGR
jgi:hypothetical protein